MDRISEDYINDCVCRAERNHKLIVILNAMDQRQIDFDYDLSKKSVEESYKMVSQ